MGEAFGKGLHGGCNALSGLTCVDFVRNMTCLPVVLCISFLCEALKDCNMGYGTDCLLIPAHTW